MTDAIRRLEDLADNYARSETPENREFVSGVEYGLTVAIAAIKAAQRAGCNTERGNNGTEQ